MTAARTRSSSSGTGSARAPKLGGEGNVQLPDELFGERFHESVVYEAARAEQLSRRRGTAATKTRSDVRGGGTKPWRQKGTGRARAGSIRAPQWTGGGRAFGPRPRNYTLKVNRKARRRALRAALSLHAERGSIAVVDAGSFEQPSTKQAADALDRWQANGTVLVLLAEDEDVCARSFRNIDRVNVVTATDAGIADVLAAASVVVSSAALELLAQLASQPAAGDEGR
jgi:large subunit ribosomal protein L4